MKPGLDASEVEQRVREVGKESLIEAKVDVDRLLAHKNWRVRSAALDIVWWGLGATDGIESTIEILLRDDDEDIRFQIAAGPKGLQLVAQLLFAASTL